MKSPCRTCPRRGDRLKCWRDCAALDEYRAELDRVDPEEARRAMIEALKLLGVCVLTGQSLAQTEAEIEAKEKTPGEGGGKSLARTA